MDLLAALHFFLGSEEISGWEVAVAAVVEEAFLLNIALEVLLEVEAHHIPEVVFDEVVPVVDRTDSA